MSAKQQIVQMQSEFSNLLRANITLALLSWVGFFSFLKSSSFLPFIWMSLGITLYVFFSIYAKKINRAYHYYLAIYLFSILNGLSLLHSSLIFFFKEGNVISLQLLCLIVFSAFLTIMGLWSQFKIITLELKSSILENIKSGKIDMKNGYWNFAIPLYLKSPSEESKNIRTLNALSKFSPLITALGLALARIIEGDVQQVLFGICLYILSCIVIWASTKYLAIAFQVVIWERERGLIIKI